MSVPPISVSSIGGFVEVTPFSSVESLDLERDREDELLLALSSDERLFLSSGLQFQYQRNQEKMENV